MQQIQFKGPLCARHWPRHWTHCGELVLDPAPGSLILYHLHTTQREGVAGQIIYNFRSALRAHMYKLYRQLS